jgi:predicted naringenin-chalcone synthase
METAYINRMATAVPANDFHAVFARFVDTLLADKPRRRDAFTRMSARSGIEHRYSVLSAANGAGADSLDGSGFYVAGRFPGTAERMRIFAAHAPDLAVEAVERLGLGEERHAGCTREASLSNTLARSATGSGTRRSVGNIICSFTIAALRLSPANGPRALRSGSPSARCGGTRRRH